MRSAQNVLQDINSAPYYDMQGTKILPGQLVAVLESDGKSEGFGGVIRIKDGEMMFNDTPLDDLMELTDNIIVAGWIQ